MIEGQVVSKSLFMKLRVLRFGNCWRESTSMTPLSPIFSSLRPHNLPPAQRTPTQLALLPEHGGVEEFQVDKALSLANECLTWRSNSDSEEPEEKATTNRRRRQRMGKQDMPPLNAIVKKLETRPGLAHALAIGWRARPRAPELLFCNGGGGEREGKKNGCN